MAWDNDLPCDCEGDDNSDVRPVNEALEVEGKPWRI